MDSRIRRSAIALLVALATTLGSLHAQAGHTCNNVILFGYVAGMVTANPNATKCLVDSSHDRDGRILTPGSSYVAMRYHGDLDPPVATIDARLRGLGFNNEWITLARTRINQGIPGLDQWVYQSSVIPIPGGSGARGCLTGEVVFNKGFPSQYVFASNSYHTVDSSC